MAYALPHEVMPALGWGRRRRRRREALERQRREAEARKAAAVEQARAAAAAYPARIAAYQQQLRECAEARTRYAQAAAEARGQVATITQQKQALQEQLRAQAQEMQEIDRELNVPMEGSMPYELDDELIDLAQRRRRRGVPGITPAAMPGVTPAGLPGIGAQPAGMFAEGGMFLGLLVIVGIVVLASTRR